MKEPKVIYKNKDFLIIDKPAGLIVHGTHVSQARVRKDEAPEPTLADWLAAHYPEVKKVGDDPVLRPGIVHRLDKDTSGVMIVPRNQETFEYLKSQFQEHAIKKTYIALVRGLPRRPYGVIDMPIGMMNGTLKRSTRSRKDAKEAVTEYWVRKELRSADNPDKFALLDVKPKTGRTHQIRVHLASIGHPIMGDSLYGGKGRPGFAARPLLHAAKIEFTGKGGKAFEFSADLPQDFSLVIHSLLPVK